MLLNFWYAVELSTHVTERPRKVRVLGQDLALYRDGARVVALNDVCPHRGGSLAGGFRDGACLRCPYHGWRFDAAGRCTDIPANPPGAPIPRRARVDAYPTDERYGFVWVFLGDLPEAERPPIPTFPEFGEPGWRPIWGTFEWRAHYARVVENGLDFAHGPFVHARSFGNPDEPMVEDYEVTTDEWGGGARLTVPASRPRGLWKYFWPSARPRVPVRLQFYMPNLIRIELQPTPRWRIIIFDSNVPVDETHTRTLWVAHRNFFPGAWADGDARRRTLEIFREDLPVVEAIRPVAPGSSAQGEVPLKSDQLPLAYRRLRRKYLEMGWGVDGVVLREAGAADQSVAPAGAFAAPSPGRREDAGSFPVPGLPRLDLKARRPPQPG